MIAFEFGRAPPVGAAVVGSWWKKLVGDRGERAAARYLRRQGFKIIARQHASSLGEIDLIALDNGVVVFVEVKTRRTNSAGEPAEAVNHEKQRRLTRAAMAYLKQKRLLDCSARFDVVSVVWADSSRQPELQHFPNAFEPVGFGQMYS